ncbi:Asp23/Gls24 family envelope stress response protein [Staphylococcus chromogenes]|nr:Asp23/Gls24 family envelope stress response protein [Staphylococcus chromogenes]
MTQARVSISERAITKIVAAAVRSVPGTITHSAGLDRLTGRAFPRYDVHINDATGRVSVETFIAVTWPSPVMDIAATVRETVTAHVTAFTGLAVEQVNVVVGPVVPGAHRITKEQLSTTPPQIHPVSVQAQPIRHLDPDVRPRPLTPITVRRFRR